MSIIIVLLKCIEKFININKNKYKMINICYTSIEVLIFEYIWEYRDILTF